MKNITLAVIVSLGAAGLAGCASHGKTSPTPIAAPVVAPPASTNVLSDEKARISYAIGMTFGHNFQMQGVEVDPDMLARGLKDMQSGGTTLLTQEQMHDTLTEYQKTLAAKQQLIARGGRREKQGGRRGVSGDEQKQPGRHHPA